LDLEIQKGEFLVLLGPSGCGKTTTMRCIVGLEEPDAGRVEIGGRVMFDARSGINVPTHRRNIGMVFQSYAIWPHRTVYENVSFPLEMRRVPKSEARQRVGRVLELLALDGLAKRGASKLSGGQMQRVALARSLVMEPTVLLLDEPLSNLDAKLRDRLRVELRSIQQTLGITAIYVTHDQEEALALADRIAIMRGGNVVQIGTPNEIYNNPANAFVAGFVGSSNLYEARIEPGVATIGDLRLEIASTTPARDSAYVSIRPEHVRVDGQGTNRLPGRIRVALFLGGRTQYEVDLDGGLAMRVVESVSGHASLRSGDSVTVAFSPEHVQVLPE
jgi:iron(III) transport system ATP-binding protein